MTNFTADEDLEILLDDVTLGFKHANVAGLSANPDIRKVGDAKSSTTIYGIVEIGRAKRGRSNNTRTHRNEFYLITGILRYKDLNNPPIRTIANLMMDEFERVLDLNTLTAANGYLYELLEANPRGNNSNLVFDWILEAIRYNVRADGT